MGRLAWVDGGGANSGSEANLACGRTTAAYKFDGSELASVSAGNARVGDLWHGAARIIAESARTNIIKNSDDISAWTSVAGATSSAAGVTWSGAAGRDIASNGGTWHRYETESGAVSYSIGDDMVTTFFYEFGDSANCRLSMDNTTEGSNSHLVGNPVGSLTVNSTASGATSILHDEVFGEVNLATMLVDLDAASSLIKMAVGPGSGTVGEEIRVYMGGVYQQTYTPTHVTTGASAATYTADDLTFPNSPNWLAGKDFVAVYSYQSEAAAADLSAEVLLDLDNGTTQLTIDTTNVSCTDGTNTVSVAHAGIYAPDTDVSIVLATVGGSMIVGIAPDGGTITWAAASATYSAPTYHTELLIAPAPIAPHYIQRVGIYDGAEFATLGDAQTWAQNQETAGWPAPATSRKYTRRQLLGTHARRRV